MTEKTIELKVAYNPNGGLDVSKRTIRTTGKNEGTWSGWTFAGHPSVDYLGYFLFRELTKHYYQSETIKTPDDIVSAINSLRDTIKTTNAEVAKAFQENVTIGD